MSSKLPPLPSHFYKYRSLADDQSLERVRKILLDNELFWTSPLAFNDPFDCAPVPTLPNSALVRQSRIKKLARKLARGATRNERRSQTRLAKNIGPRVLERQMRSDIAQHMGRVAICSLSELNDNILMWSHYADSHRGICLRFTPRSPYRFPPAAPPLFELAMPVVYQVERPPLDIPVVNPDDALRQTLLTKADFWEYEKEWRLFDVYGKQGLRKFPAGQLDAIILGARISDSCRGLIEGWVKERPTPTEILNASFDEKLFRLNIS